MLKAGVLENPHVDAGIAFHVVSGIPSGTIMCGSGTCMAGCILFQIHIKGTGCHGAMPEAGVDPINIAAHVYLSLQEIIAREIAPTQPAALTIGRFTAGEAPNIIPEDVILEEAFVQWITRYPNISLTELKKSPFRQLLSFADRLV